MERVREFYDRLFEPLVESEGPLDPATLTSIVGFDAGGPISLCTIGSGKDDGFMTYVSCELAVRPEQLPADFGRYELMVTCDSESWVRSILTEVGRMSLEVEFGHHHTLDISPWVGARATIQGLAFELAHRVAFGREKYGLVRLLGLTRTELERAHRDGAADVISSLRLAGAYPRTRIGRSRKGRRP